GAPLACLLADDQSPLVAFRNGEKRVAAGRNLGVADFQVRVGDKRCGFIRARPPDLAKGNETAENLAALGARTRIVICDPLAAPECAARFARRARPRPLVLLGDPRGCRSHNNKTSQANNCQSLLHYPSSVSNEIDAA